MAFIGLFFIGILAIAGVLGIILLIIGFILHNSLLCTVSLVMSLPLMTILLIWLITKICETISYHIRLKSFRFCIDEGRYKKAEKLLKKGKASVYCGIHSDEPVKKGEYLYFFKICQIQQNSRNYKNCEEKVKFFIDHGMDVEYRFFKHDKNDKNHFSSSYIEKILKINKISSIDECGMTPIMYAAKAGNIKVVKLLLDNGADVNAVSYCGQTALMLGSRCTGAEMVNLLIEQGANIKAKDNFEFSPLDYAIYYNNIEAVKLLIEKGADVNEISFYGQMPLMFSLNSEKTGITELLLENGADKNIVDNLGHTAFDYAMIEKRFKAGEIIRQHP